MIVTLTANPSIDRTLEVEGLERGAVLRARASRVHPGGKGINVSRALARNGVPTRAVLPAGGHEGGQLLHLLAELGLADLEVTPVEIGAPIRENLTIAEPDGTVTKVNAPGPVLTDDEVAALATATVEAGRGADLVALCGALPPGAPEALYARLVVEIHAIGVRVAVDTSGPAMGEVIGAGPDLIKPNVEELAEAVGHPVDGIPSAVAAARELLERGVGEVLVSMGPDGALLVTRDAAWRSWTPPVAVRSTVGAGDATLAGFLAAGGDGAESLRAAVGWGAAAVALPGTEMPGPNDIDPGEVRLERLEHGLGGERRVG